MRVWMNNLFSAYSTIQFNATKSLFNVKKLIEIRVDGVYGSGKLFS